MKWGNLHTWSKQPEAIVKKQLGGHDIPCSQLAFYFEVLGHGIEQM